MVKSNGNFRTYMLIVKILLQKNDKQWIYKYLIVQSSVSKVKHNFFLHSGGTIGQFINLLILRTMGHK
jgi:hypothetical protein